MKGEICTICAICAICGLSSPPRAEALRLERRLADLVNAAYGLTPEDVALLWATAPPRMPGGKGEGGRMKGEG